MSKPKAGVAVDVEIPPIKLTLSDLAYMRGLGDKSFHCSVARKTHDKLLFLGLIERATIPPCSKELAQYEADRQKAIDKIEAACAKKDYDKAFEAIDSFRWTRKPKPVDGFVLTKAGRDLLARGKAKSTITASGCA